MASAELNGKVWTPNTQQICQRMLRASLSLQSDEELDQYIRETLHSGNALVGTCAMGLAPEKGAVVDANMKVYGVQGLRVADSSVIPVIPGIFSIHIQDFISARAISNGTFNQQRMIVQMLTSLQTPEHIL